MLGQLGLIVVTLLRVVAGHEDEKEFSAKRLADLQSKWGFEVHVPYMLCLSYTD